MRIKSLRFLLGVSLAVVCVFSNSTILAEDDESEKKSDKFEFEHALFETPFRLMVDDQPLNTEAKQMYPSPAMFDVDNDGQIELVVGDIFGSLNVYENKNDSGSGDPEWAEHVALETAEGKAIKVSNW